MKKSMLQRSLGSFGISAVNGLIANLIIESVGRMITGDNHFVPLAREYIAWFPSVTIAMEVNILLYGVIGAAFAAAAAVFECDRLGFVVQSLLYFILTGLVWVPILTLVWQLHRYPEALFFTLCGYAGTYLIMLFVGYRITKKEVRQINQVLRQQSL